MTASGKGREAEAKQKKFTEPSRGESAAAQGGAGEEGIMSASTAINRRPVDSPIQPFHHLQNQHQHQHMAIESPLHRVLTRERRDTPYPGQLEMGSGVLRALACVRGGIAPSGLSLPTTTTTTPSETSSVIDLTAEESDQDDYEDDDDDEEDEQYDEQLKDSAYDDYDDEGDEDGEEQEEEGGVDRNLCLEQDGGVSAVRDMMEGACMIGEGERSDIEDEEMVWSQDGHSDADDEEDDDEEGGDEDGDDDDDGEEDEKHGEEEEDMDPCGDEDAGGLQLQETPVSSVSLASSYSPQHPMWAEQGSESGNNHLISVKRTSPKSGGGDSSDEEGGRTSLPASLEPCAIGPEEIFAGGSRDYRGGDDENLALDCDFILELLREDGNAMFDLDHGIDGLELLPLEQQQQPLQTSAQQLYLECEVYDQLNSEEHAGVDQQHHHGVGEDYYQVVASSSDVYQHDDVHDSSGEPLDLAEVDQQRLQCSPAHHYAPPEAAPSPPFSVLQTQCLSSTKTLAQLFGLPKPLYLSPSHPPTLSVLEHMGYTRRMRRPREGQLVLPPSLTPYLSQMTAFLSPSADADQEESPPTQSVASPTFKRKEAVTAISRRSRSRSEAKRGRVETASKRTPEPSNHQRSAAHPFCGGASNQQEESQASHMVEGDTGAGQFHVDNLLTYLDSPMTVSFDASSTPCSTPSSPASMRHSNPSSPAGMLHPATADLHSQLAALTRNAAHNSVCHNSADRSPSATENDALGDEDFLEEVMQFASQLEHDLLS